MSMPLIFFSGTGNKSHRGRIIDTCQAQLLSCHPKYFLDARQWLYEAFRHPRSKERYLMLDSGAFTAWSLGEPSNIKEVLRNYDKVVERYCHYFKTIYLVNLNIIPGERGRTATPDEIKQAAIESDKNFSVLQNTFGKAVLPVFHQGENLARFNEICEQSPFICISPRNDLPEKERFAWAINVHIKLRETTEHRKILTHGLAATGFEMMTEIPWYSVNSTSWIQQAAYGGILLRTKNRGFATIKISNQSPMRYKPGQHYDTLPLDMKLIIESRAHAIGLTIDNLRSQSGARELFNVHTLSDMSSK